MKCTLNPSFKNVSGRCGDMLFKTFKRPDGSKQTRVYVLPRNYKTGKVGYERKAPLSENEIGARNKFTIVSRQVKNLTDEQRKQYAKEWKAAKYKYNGKKYNTLRGYIMARLYADMDAASRTQSGV